MEIYTPTAIIDTICIFLRECIAARKWGTIMGKSSDAPEDANLQMPYVYSFLCPPDDMNEDYPQKIPSITVMLGNISIDPNTGAFRVPVQIHTAQVYPAVSESEKAVPNGNGNYDIEPREGYTREEAQRNLYKDALYLLESVGCMVQSMSLRTENLTITPPDPTLPDFPYITGRIDFDVTQNVPSSMKRSFESNKAFIDSWLG